MEKQINHLDRILHAIPIIAHDLKIIEKPEFEYKDFPINLSDEIIQKIINDLKFKNGMPYDYFIFQNLSSPFYTCFDMGTELGYINRNGNFDFENVKLQYSYKSMMDFSRENCIDPLLQGFFNSKMKDIRKLFDKIATFYHSINKQAIENSYGFHQVLYILFNGSMMIGYDCSRKYFNTLKNKNV